MTRRIKKRYPAMTQTEGSGAIVHRTLGTEFLNTVDPFLLLDEFDLKAAAASPGFANHPHRGFETITYLFKGIMTHKDTAGNTGTMTAGGIQRMTAGRGLIHSETPSYKEGDVHGMQLWVNLPAKDKMQAPSYHDVDAKNVPVQETDDVMVRVLSGALGDATGPLDPGATDLVYYDITYKRTSLASMPVPMGHSAMIYVVNGKAAVGSRSAEARELAELTDDKDYVDLEAFEGSRVLLLAAKPIKEPVERYGPFVMNTVQELEEAYADYNAGKFGKVD